MLDGSFLDGARFQRGILTLETDRRVLTRVSLPRISVSSGFLPRACLEIILATMVTIP